VRTEVEICHEKRNELCRQLHKTGSGFCYKRAKEKISPNIGRSRSKGCGDFLQPGCRNSGKTKGKILFQNETREPKTHEKMRGKI